MNKRNSLRREGKKNIHAFRTGVIFEPYNYSTEYGVLERGWHSLWKTGGVYFSTLYILYSLPPNKITTTGLPPSYPPPPHTSSNDKALSALIGVVASRSSSGRKNQVCIVTYIKLYKMYKLLLKNLVHQLGNRQ